MINKDLFTFSSHYGQNLLPPFTDLGLGHVTCFHHGTLNGTDRNRDPKCAEHLYSNLQGKKNLGCFWPDPQHKTYWKDLSLTCSLKHNYILNHTSANLEIHEGKCAYLKPWEFCICLLPRKADRYTVTFISSNLIDFLFD